MRSALLVNLVVLVLPSITTAAELRMQWQALGPDDREIATQPDVPLILDIYFQLNSGESLSSLGFSNGYVPSTSQLSTSARDGWADESLHDVLGGESQRVVFSGPVLDGPGEFLIGSQTIRLDDVGDGSPKAIMFRLEPIVLDGAGNRYAFSAFPTSLIGYYSIGAGFPDTIWCDPISCLPDLLHAIITHPTRDCNGNFVADSVDVAGGDSADADANGIPDECETMVLYVDENSTGLNYGTSWDHAYADLRQAFDVAHGTGASVTEIWVAAGTYRPGTSRVAAFRLRSGLGAYGGFAAGATARDQRDPRANSTILSGDLAGNDGPEPANTDENSYHVVMGVEPGTTAVLDGFIITAGHANGLDYPFDQGAGLYVHMGSPTLANCTFTRNVASDRGGGMFSAWSRNWPYNTRAATLSNCTFSNNIADDGAGLYNRTSSTTLINCVFSGNAARDRGGAIHSWPGSHSTITNCSMSGNSAVSGGGAMYVWGLTRPTVTNCILWDNGPEPVYDGRGLMTIAFSDVQGGWPGVGNLDLDPLFVDADGEDDVPGTEDDDLRLSAASPAIDAGDNTAVPSGVTTNVDGNPRFIDYAGAPDTGNGLPPIVDMGAYEFELCVDDGECDDGTACTVDTCDLVAGVCFHVPDHTFCDDGLFCNGLEICDAALGCGPGAPPDCDDGDTCTDDACVGGDCSHSPVTICADNDGCCPLGCTRGDDLDCACDVPSAMINPDPANGAVDVPADSELQWSTSQGAFVVPEPFGSATSPTVSISRTTLNPPFIAEPMTVEDFDLSEPGSGHARRAAHVLGGAAIVVIGFDDLGEDVVVGKQYAAQGVIFSSWNGGTPTTVDASSPVIPAEPIGLACLPYFTTDLLVNFMGTTTAAGAMVDLGEIGDGLEIQAYDEPDGTGNLLASASTVVEGFLGVSAPGIASVKFLLPVSGSLTSYLIDNFTFSEIAGGCPTTYNVYLGTDSGAMSLTCEGVDVPKCDPGRLAENTTYFWQVVATDCCGNSSGPVWSFTTGGECAGAVDGTPCTDDGIACTADLCDAVKGACVHVPDDRLCDDGEYCNGAEVCNAAAGCEPGSVPCPDRLCVEAEKACTEPAVPAVSTWGLIVLLLLLMTGVRIRFGNHRLE